ncbi:hypothetical protein BaRGS_00003684 [Batillaria attramentaria]|uniref:Uncharacterized protein n=1 Tax=Batillaria attramentaria TaxID=370345 RepID=A0ABD0LZK9_9CAEN
MYYYRPVCTVIVFPLYIVHVAPSGTAVLSPYLLTRRLMCTPGNLHSCIHTPHVASHPINHRVTRRSLQTLKSAAKNRTPGPLRVLCIPGGLVFSPTLLSPWSYAGIGYKSTPTLTESRESEGGKLSKPMMSYHGKQTTFSAIVPRPAFGRTEPERFALNVLFDLTEVRVLEAFAIFKHQIYRSSSDFTVEISQVFDQRSVKITGTTPGA